MAYRVLARAYRSRTFDEVVGQEAIATTLINAITSQRVHHAYLFTGTRGVGKTSMARILAKALNCLHTDEPTITPCLECESCKLIAEGEDVDVVEIDGASNNGVDNIRELRGNVAFRPARSRYKIYIIDEVHMLSTAAFNALLKTLEEPPPHVKFIFATTVAEKVLDTIKSRCQRFDFQAIGADAIATHLQQVIEGEGIQGDEDAVRRIARLANGSMRDGLSLLDKVLSHESKHVTAAIVDEIIPPPHDEMAAAVFSAIAQQDAAAALTALDRALQSGRTVERFCDQLIEHLRTLMLMCVCGSDSDLVDVSGTMRTELTEQASQFDAPTYVYMISLLEGLHRATKTSAAARPLADAAMVRLSMTHQFSDIGQLVKQLNDKSGATARSVPLKKNETRANALVPSRSKAEPRLLPTGCSTSPSSSAEAGRPSIGDTRDESSGPSDTQAGGPESERLGAASSALVSATTQASDHSQTPAEPAGSSLSAEVRERVTADPLVQRVREAVDGTLIDIRPAPEKNAEKTTV